MTVLLLEPAAAEFTAAVERYNAESDGLGYEFAVEIQATLERISRFPDAVLEMEGDRHRQGVLRKRSSARYT